MIFLKLFSHIYKLPFFLKCRKLKFQTILHINRVKNYISEYGENIFSSRGDIWFCKLCEVKTLCEKKILHLKIDKHIRAIERFSSQQLLQLLPTS